ncbi:hypothetical protein Emag_001227 [Eimeria magna]
MGRKKSEPKDSQFCSNLGGSTAGNSSSSSSTCDKSKEAAPKRDNSGIMSLSSSAERVLGTWSSSSSGRGQRESSSCDRAPDEERPSSDSRFVSDAVLRDLVFEDYSRASSWEMLLHHLLSSFMPLPAARRRYLSQVTAANVRASAAAAGDASPAQGFQSPVGSNNVSRHAFSLLPQDFACSCPSSSHKQQREPCTVSLRLFAPLVIETLLSCPLQNQQRLRLTYTCAAPLPDLCCTCSGRTSEDFKSGSTVSTEALRFAEEHGIPTSLFKPQQLHRSSSRNCTNSESRCGTCAACVMRWERLFPSRASFVQRDFGVPEFLLLETVRLPEAAAAKVAQAAAEGELYNADADAAAAAAIPVRIPKHAASTRLAAFGLASRAAQQQNDSTQPDHVQQQVLLGNLPLFCIHSPQHEACVGSHVFARHSRSSTWTTGEELAKGATGSAKGSTPVGGGEQQRAASLIASDDVVPLTIREYESQFLSSAFASDDRTKFLHMLLPHLGVKLGLPEQSQYRPQQDHALQILQHLFVAAQYTFFLPRPWQLEWGSSPESTSAAGTTGVQESAPEAWWLQQGQSSISSPTSSNSVTSSATNSDMDQWREVAREAGSPLLDEDKNAAATADVLLQLLLQQPCVFQDVHASCCSPLQSLKDFRSCSSSSRSPRVTAFDCRLRFTLEQPLMRAHEKLMECWSGSMKRKRGQQHADMLPQLAAASFLQDDLLRQHCGVTSRVHRLGLLLLACSSSASQSLCEGDSRCNRTIFQLPFLSLSPAILREADRCGARQRVEARRQQHERRAASRRSRSGNFTPSSISRSSSLSSVESNLSETTLEALEAKVQHLFRPMTRQQQLLIHEQQVKRLLLIGRSWRACTCCSSSCGCCGVDLAFGLLWGASSCSSFFTELALLAGEQQRLQQLQEVWQLLLVRLRAVWDRGLLLPRVVSGLTSGTAAAACSAHFGGRGRLHPVSALAAARGASCCPDGPSALPDFCCSFLQQLMQHLNCALQQQRLQWLQQQLPQEQQQQPFESLRFVLLPHKSLSDLREPMLPILPPITEQTLSIHEALLRERRSSGSGSHEAFGRYCESLLLSANSNKCTAREGVAWWEHCFAGLPRGVEQLLQHRRHLLRQQEAARAAAAAAFSSASHPLGGIHQAASSAVAAALAAAQAESGAVETEGSETSSAVDPHLSFFNCVVEGEVALHGLESLSTPDVLGQLLRILVASLVEQCRLACACLFDPSGSTGIRRCLYTPGVAAECLTQKSSTIRRHLASGKCRGRLFPCHLPALQASADDLQRHAIAHVAAAAPAGTGEDALVWVPSLNLLAACMRCEFMFSAAAALCRVFGSKPAALLMVNRTLHQLYQQLLQHERIAAAAISSGKSGCHGECQADNVPEAECDLLLPLLSCSEKLALQQMLQRYSGDTGISLALRESGASPWDARLPWPPFAQEYAYLLLSHAEASKRGQRWRFYCREQHGDRALAIVRERSFQ